MNVETLRKATAEAKRFLEIAAKVRVECLASGYMRVIDSTRESAACKRASMDLTRALSELRRSG